MKKIFNFGGLDIKLWTEDIEEEALEQAKNLSKLDFAFGHIALMPDVHVGFGMPIGGVLATKGYIIPNAVGVDIGCGLRAAKLDLRKDQVDSRSLKAIVDKAHRTIPLGFKRQKEARDWSGFHREIDSPIINQELDKAAYQLGSLGGGNHFMSIEEANDGQLWLLVHSGSRNFGHTVANYYNDLAKNLTMNKDSKDLAALALDSPDGKNYFRDMNYVLEFARENRRQLLEDFYKIVREELGGEIIETIDCHHNYAAEEEHFGQKVLVHRKGAINADKGRLGIIPGSMGTASYIVEGLGEEESFRSSSHGAGRDMSRKEANRSIDRLDFIDKMEGIVYKKSRDLSEAPQAYKDIDEVMENQKDLTRILVELNPRAVIKA